ncbi:PDZ domain-containing protein [Alkalihalophilus lindianensis]|uniref:PDZ domain-containing protein n=1 Tax=Alkalihalophilus lindianensis TaxID=1630542 RepID=A0ABU3XAA6_9BACI|nr:PDZ domain-containing protein [Alkalihalophilus lindianensis]MDV2684243.1 PDZ domain-containing protein [Alkalihalophilus lindianensis]
MIIDILKSLGLTIGSFFANPILYIGLFVIFLIAHRRVQKERVAFHTRVTDRIADFVIPFWSAVVVGLLISVATLGAGIVITIPLLFLMIGVTILMVLTTYVRWMSPAYVMGLALLAIAFAPFVGDIPYLAEGVAAVGEFPLYQFALILALLVIGEGILIYRNGDVYTSPGVERSKRGKWVGFQEAKRMWIVPVFFLVPEGIIPSFEFWPVFTLGETSFQPILFPVLIGFQQQVRSSLPSAPIKMMGMRVVGVGLLLAVLAVVSYWYPFVAVLMASIAIISRELLWMVAKSRDESQPAFYNSKQKGCVILGIIPGSPATKMKLEVGETIVKVNGQTVQDEKSFYEALQLNAAAFCKLDVLDHAGEVRFAQGALYDGQHHQLGVLLVKHDYQLQDSVI